MKSPALGAAQYLVLALQLLGTPARGAQRRLIAQDRQQSRVVPGLLDKIVGAAAHRFHCDVDGAPGRHHHHRQFGIQRADAFGQSQSFLAGRRIARVVQIHQHHRNALPLEDLDNSIRVHSLHRGQAFGLQQEAQCFQHIALVVGNQNRQCFSHGMGPVGSAGMPRGSLRASAPLLPDRRSSSTPTRILLACRSRPQRKGHSEQVMRPQNLSECP